MVHHLLSKVTLNHAYSTRSKVKKLANRNETLSSTTANPKAQVLVQEIIQIYQQLAKAAPDLQPSPHMNALFTKLVQICTSPLEQAISDQVLHHPAIRQLRQHLCQLCSQGEYLMELTWTRQHVAGTPPHLSALPWQPSNVTSGNSSPKQQDQKPRIDTWKDAVAQQLSQFLYYGNYVDLTRLECHALLAVGACLGHVIWIGSGPLPMSSMEMMLQHHETIHRLDNIDVDMDAIDISFQLNQKLPWPPAIRSRFGYHATNALDYTDYHLADVICLGALVGDVPEEGGRKNAEGSDDQRKLEIIIQVAKKMRPGAWMLIRSAHGLRQLLYPALVPSHFYQCTRLFGLLEVVLELHPHNDVVNSVLIARRLG